MSNGRNLRSEKRGLCPRTEKTQVAAVQASWRNRLNPMTLLCFYFFLFISFFILLLLCPSSRRSLYVWKKSFIFSTEKQVAGTTPVYIWHRSQSYPVKAVAFRSNVHFRPGKESGWRLWCRSRRKQKKMMKTMKRKNWLEQEVAAESHASRQKKET